MINMSLENFFDIQARTSFIFDVSVVAWVDSCAGGSSWPLWIWCGSSGDVPVATSLQGAQFTEDRIQVDILGIYKKARIAYFILKEN